MAGKPPLAEETNLRLIVESIRQLFFGRSLAVGTVTFTQNVTSTTVAATNCGEDSVITLTPRTAAAGTEFGAGTWYISSVTRGSFVITHANSATAGRTYDYSIRG